MATEIPKGPWTIEALGKELYTKLAIENGCGKPEAGFTPALDLTLAYNAQQAAKATKPAKAEPAKAEKE